MTEFQFHPLREKTLSKIRDVGISDAETVEKAVFNKAVHRCRFQAVPCCWANPSFAECYKGSALAVLCNAEAVKEALGNGITAADVVHRRPDELRPDIWQALVDKKRERDAAYGAKPRANTDMYRCKKCKSKECHYYELQTRSGDEPMTIFITCLDCGNRWRMEG
nr:putative transcription elongation factor TFIIS [Oceanusvirus sp.]